MHSNALTPVPVPGTDRPIMAGQFDGKPEVALRHASRSARSRFAQIEDRMEVAS